MKDWRLSFKLRLSYQELVAVEKARHKKKRHSSELDVARNNNSSGPKP